jgi:hypothetical protein
MPAISMYLSTSSFLAEEATAIRNPVSRVRRNSSGTAENGRTSGRYSVLKRVDRHYSSSLPCHAGHQQTGRRGISLSPLLPIWPRTCAKLTSWPNFGRGARPQGARVVAGVGEDEAAGVAQHVGMRFEIEAGLDAGPLDHLGEAGSGERRAAFADEKEGRPRLVPAVMWLEFRAAQSPGN